MDKDRLDRQIEFIREIDKERALADRRIWQTLQERKMTLSMHGIWQL